MILLALALAQVLSSSTTVLAVGDDPRVAVVGAAELDDGPGVRLRFSSAAVRVQAAGTLNLIWLDDGETDADEGGGNRFVVQTAAPQAAPASAPLVGDTVVVATMSTVTIIKRTEALFGERRLLAIIVDGEVGPPPPPRPTLVVLGDSWATGFGVRGDLVDPKLGKAPGPRCPFTPDTQDVTQAWPWGLAQRLNVDVAVVAWSGRGLTRDYEGDERPPSVGALWDASTVAPARLAGVVVALGHNDGFPGLPDADRFTAAWRRTRASLTQRLGATVPVIVLVPRFNDTPPAIDRQAAFRVNFAAGSDGDVSLITEPEMDISLGLGCVWHPGTRAQAAMAASLANLIQPVLSSVP